jgi:hypothetical protein
LAWLGKTLKDQKIAAFGNAYDESTFILQALPKAAIFFLM